MQGQMQSSQGFWNCQQPMLVAKQKYLSQNPIAKTDQMQKKTNTSKSDNITNRKQTNEKPLKAIC